MIKIILNDEILIEMAKIKTTKEIALFFNVCPDTVLKNLRRLNVKSVRKLDEQGRRNISLGKRKFYKENPDKHIWRNKEKFKSVPCEKLKEWLISKKIEFIEEYRIQESEYNYSLDIAFPDKKIAIEVNGNQHYNYDGTLTEYYQKRHNYIESLGWKVYELHFSLCFNILEIENMIPTILSSQNKVEFNYKTYIKNMEIKTSWCIYSDFNEKPFFRGEL